MDFKLWGGPYFGVLGCGSCMEPTPGPGGVLPSGSDQEKFKILRSVTRKTVGAMRIVAKFGAERW